MGLVGFEPTQHLIRLLPTIHLVPAHKFTKYLLNNLPQLFVRTTLTITLAVKQEPPYDAVATDLGISCEVQGIYTPQGGAEHRRVLELLSQKKGGMGGSHPIGGTGVEPMSERAASCSHVVPRA